MSAPVVVIPYEKQDEAQANRGCGAACLSMVYRSFGKEIAQAEIWPAISKPNKAGSISSTTHLMVQDALNRGLKAVAIQARHPLQALRLCREAGIRAILNHRMKQESPSGHYTVLVDIDDKTVTLHDPALGPSRRLSHAELFELWHPGIPNSEIAGNVLIGISEEPSPATACWLCQTAFPAGVVCPKCAKPVLLQPNAVLGCLNLSCIARMWNYICCPTCDFTWSFTVQGEEATTAAAGPAAGPDATEEKTPGALDLSAVFAALETFKQKIMSLPVAANNTLVLQHFDAMAALQDKLKLAAAEHQANVKFTFDQLDALAQSAKTKQEEHDKRVAELKTPLPALDGNALGRALMKNLGFIQ